MSLTNGDAVTRRRFVTTSGAGVAAALVAGCTGADATEASLTAEDQSGLGETVTVAEASADVEFYVGVEWTGGEETTDAFEAESVQEDVEVAMEPTINETTTLEVTVHAAEDGEALATEEIQYEVPAEGELAVEDQSGGGRELIVDEASATVEHYLAVRYDGQETTTQTFQRGTTSEEVVVSLRPELQRSRSVEVAVHDASDDAVLASESVEYDTVATLNVDGAEGEGEVVTIGEVGAEQDYYVDLHYGGETVATRTFPGGTTQQNLDIELSPAIDHTVQMDIDVHADDGAEELVSQSVQYKYRGAILAVDDQSGDGGFMTVDLAEATTDYYVELRYDGEVATSRTFTAGTVQENVQVSFDPEIDETTTVRVAIRAADDDEELYGKPIEYEVN